MKEKILIINDYFLPAKLAGGVVKSLNNTLDLLHNEFDFVVVCGSSEVGSKKIFPEARRNKLVQKDGYKVFYVNGFWGYVHLIKLLKSKEFSKIHINSCFSFWYSILPLSIISFLKFFNWPVEIILSPRGELLSGALEIKKLKKYLYLLFAKCIKMYSRVVWHASTDFELCSIQRIFGMDITYIISRDPALPKIASFHEEIVASSDLLKLVFVSRVTKKKNLHFILGLLSKISFPVEFTIVGPHEDIQYWSTCQKLIDNLPDNIKVIVVGPISYETVVEYYVGADIFVLPTKGENFGHVFVEALSAGLVVYCSEQTIWKQSSNPAVKSLRLDEETWRSELIEYFRKSSAEKLEMRREAQKLVKANFLEEEEFENVRKIYTIKNHI